MTILGIDPVKSGAVAVLDEGGELLAVEDMPSLFEANGRPPRTRPCLRAARRRQVLSRLKTLPESLSLYQLWRSLRVPPAATSGKRSRSRS
jgi:hypothetical protein